MQSTKSDKVNIFDSAAVEVSNPKSKSDKAVIPVTDPKLAAAMAQLIKARESKAAAEQSEAEAEAILKAYCSNLWMTEYKATGVKPESFSIENKAKQNIMYVVQDQYKKVDEDRAKYLIETYGKGVLVESEETFVMNAKMVEKYHKQIAAAIAKAKDIPMDAKKTMLIKKVKYSIVKGLVTKIVEVAKKMKKVTPEVIFNEIAPSQLLNVIGDKPEAK